MWGIWGDIENGKEMFDKLMILLDGTNTTDYISTELKIPKKKLLSILDTLHKHSLVDFI